MYYVGDDYMIDESVKCEIINLQDELITLKYFIDKINNIVSIINNNHNINIMSNIIHFFSKNVNILCTQWCYSYIIYIKK